jgi:hypothetical protein
MDYIISFWFSWLGMAILLLILIGLIVFLLVLRNRREDED